MIGPGPVQFIKSIDHLAMDGGRALGNDGEGRRSKTETMVITAVIGSIGAVRRSARILGPFGTKQGNRHRCVVKGTDDTSDVAPFPTAAAAIAAAATSISAQYFHLISDGQSMRGQQMTSGACKRCATRVGTIRDTATGSRRRRCTGRRRRSRLQVNHCPAVQADRNAFDLQPPKDGLRSLLRRLLPSLLRLRLTRLRRL